MFDVLASKPNGISIQKLRDTVKEQLELKDEKILYNLRDVWLASANLQGGLPIINVNNKPKLGEGVYTIPDAAHILNLNASKVRRWVNGYWKVMTENKIHLQPLNLHMWGTSKDRAFNFYTLVEINSVMAFREMGISFPRIRQARNELSKRFNTEFPFASHELLCDGKRIMVALKDCEVGAALTLGAKGETVFQKIIEPFCQKLDFNKDTELAERYWPLGRNCSIVVDPHHGFGRPTIQGSNIATETIFNFIRAGESKQTLSDMYDISMEQISDVVRFESKEAA